MLDAERIVAFVVVGALVALAIYEVWVYRWARAEESRVWTR